MDEVRLLRKFNCKQKYSREYLLLLVLRTQLVYETLLIALNCLMNLSLHFHLSHIYTTEFWTSESAISSNFSFALASLLMVTYSIGVEDLKASLIKDLHCTMIGLHMGLSVGYSRGVGHWGWLLFVGVVGALVVAVAAGVAVVVEQRRLCNEIRCIEGEDRRALRRGDEMEEQQFSETL